MLSSCFGRRRDSDAAEREPLLPQYSQDTHLQREVARKLHSYQMLRSLSQGYMPSTEQAITNLRTLLAAITASDDGIAMTMSTLSPSSRRILRLTNQFIEQFIVLLRHKNGNDQLQDLIWFLRHSQVNVDVNDIRARARRVGQETHGLAAAYQSLRTVGELLFLNSDFRIFAADLGTVGRQVLSDSAVALSGAAGRAAQDIKPDENVVRQDENQENSEPNGNKAANSSADLQQETQRVGGIIAEGGSEVVISAIESAEDKLKGDEGQVLLKRLQKAVTSLRQRKDYSDSVSILSILIKRYATYYSRAAEEVSQALEDDVNENREMDRAFRKLWELMMSFGDKKEWQKCEELLNKVMTHKEKDPEFEGFMQEVGDSLQKLLTDPKFFNNAGSKLQELREKSKKIGTESNLRQDVDELLYQLSATVQSVLHDEDIQNLNKTFLRAFGVLSPSNAVVNPELVQDALNVFIPLLINAIQYIPIPRLEISTPSMDLLLENLIIEPGKTVNHTSFLPYRLKVETYNDIEIRAPHVSGNGLATSSKNLLLIKLDGLSLRAEEVGFWMRTHPTGVGFLPFVCLRQFANSGIASFALDERGIDVHVEVEICRDGLEQILTLRGVRVRIHKLDYTIHKSQLSWLSWLFKPLLRPLMKATLELQLAQSIADLLHAANREVVFARERLRATRIADPSDWWTFLRAVGARLVPPDNPDLYTRVGVGAPSGIGRGEGGERGGGPDVFRGVYTPGSVVKLWNEEAVQARDRIEEYESGGWRNKVFDLHTRNLT